MLSQNQIALLINTFSQLTTNTNYVTTTRINASYKTTQSFNYEGNTVKPLLDIYSGNQVVILKDTSTGKYYAIREDFDPVLNERTFTRKYREERKKVSKQEADVAVLLCCEKNDAYEFWVTWLGDRRKNRFAYVGQLYKTLYPAEFSVWESGDSGRFEMWPYRGATGGGISTSTTDRIYDGADINVQHDYVRYKSAGFNGGGDKGGIVTPKWSRTPVEFELKVDYELSTQCYPLSRYYDVSWTFLKDGSDAGFGTYRKVKIKEERPTAFFQTKDLYKTWTVTWTSQDSGEGVSLVQESAPVVELENPIPPDSYRFVADDGFEKVVQGSPTVSIDSRTKDSHPPNIYYYYQTCTGQKRNRSLWDGVTDLPSPYTESRSFYIVNWYINGVFQNLRFPVNDEPCGRSFNLFGGYYTPTYEGPLFEYSDDTPYDPKEYNLSAATPELGTFYTSAWRDSPPDDPFIDPLETTESYIIRVFNSSGISVLSGFSSSPITHTTTLEQTKAIGFFLVDSEGTNLGGAYDEDNLDPGYSPGDDKPYDGPYKFIQEQGAVTGKFDITEVTEGISAEFYIGDEIVKEDSISGEEGIQFPEAPIIDGRTACTPQSKKGSFSYTVEEGSVFSFYLNTVYSTESESGELVEWTPFDFGRPELQGTLPGPEINYSFGELKSSFTVSYKPKGWLSIVRDLPDSDSDSEEEFGLGKEIDPYGKVYTTIIGPFMGYYGPLNMSSSALFQEIEVSLLDEYDFSGWIGWPRKKKPRLYFLEPDNFADGEPFEEADFFDPQQRVIQEYPTTLPDPVRTSLYSYGGLSYLPEEREEDWRYERATFAEDPQGGDTPFQSDHLSDNKANSSSVRQRGEKTVDITVKMADVEALLKKDKKGEVEFTIHDSQQSSKTTTQVFKMNPIRDVFEGYEDVKILAVAGVIY